MTDRELLKSAAKAIGYTAYFNKADACQLSTDGTENGYVQFWNPLTDDGDALRLAVKLRLDIDNGSPSDGNRYVCAYRCGIAMVRDPVSEIEEIEDECQRLAATRRAIVRAAASIVAAIGGAK